jgi:hypothetical protein
MFMPQKIMLRAASMEIATHMEILLDDFNAKVGRVYIFNPTDRN